MKLRSFIFIFLALLARPACADERCFHLPVTGPQELPRYTSTPLEGSPGVAVLAAEPSRFCPIVMSIYGVMLDKIESGAKTYEYRKSFPSEPASHILYYDNTVKVIRGFAKIVRTLMGAPQLIVDLTWPQSAVRASDLMGYFGDYRTGFATQISDYRKLSAPISLADAIAADPNFAVPRGYDYVENYPHLFDTLRTAARP